MSAPLSPVGPKNIAVLGTTPAIEEQQQVSPERARSGTLSSLKLEPLSMETLGTGGSQKTRARSCTLPSRKTPTFLDTILETIRSFLRNLNTAENWPVSLTDNKPATNDFLNKVEKDVLKEILSLSTENQQKFVNFLKEKKEKEKEKSIKDTFQVTQDVSYQLYLLHKAKILTDVLSVSSPKLEDNSNKTNLIKMYIACNLDIRQSEVSYSQFDTWANENTGKLANLINAILKAEKDPNSYAEVAASKELRLAAEEIKRL